MTFAERVQARMMELYGITADFHEEITPVTPDQTVDEWVEWYAEKYDLQRLREW